MVEIEIDGSAMGFLGTDGDGLALGTSEGEAHHGFIDGADLFDIEGAIGDALAIEEEQAPEQAEDRAVGDEGDLRLGISNG